ncbi:GRB2 associated binding protein 3 [Echinococcus multilocularis]|uniref:GRB2 associated binding protein 3 n=1 Tax=Echinococcus multilocularis TaxID=6211 RepID=A0A068YBC8_ECHMU|nr:GRB2 associated binding protein 3 [Echinococcus multilocularis]
MGEYKPIGKPKYQGLSFLCTGCHVLLEPRWKKRFCVFYKIRNPTETQIFFEYYKNESDKRPLGGVDLNSCDCIYEQKACNRLSNVFVIKTTYRGKVRDYPFSADSLEEMNDWISQLTKVLRMVPDQIPGSPLVDMIGRNSSSLAHFTSRRPVMSTVLPATTTKVSNFLVNSNESNESQGYLERGFTEEYRTSFGETTADDEDCYHVLPQPDHAYVNLKGGGSAVNEANFQNDQEPLHDGHGPRPDSVYFNVWDSSTIDANINDAIGDHPKLSESEQSDKEVLGTAECKETKTRCQPHTEESPCSIPENFSKTQLPKRSRTHTTSSSSSAVSFGDINESDADGNGNASSSIPLSGAGEAEAAASLSNDFAPSILGEGAGTKPKSASDAAAATSGSAIHYLDAENLDFPPHQRGSHGVANAFPAVPPKPVHLRRMIPAGATATEINASSDVSSSGYNELDPRSTQAFFMVTKRVFGDADEA